MTIIRNLMALSLAAAIATTPAWAQPKPVTMVLDWTPNTNHIGLFVAQAKGFYEDAGLGVEILPYSDTSAGTLVANHIADFGILSSLSVFTQRTAGADLIGVYAVMQKETGRLVFNADRSDIQRPRDLDGKIYAGFGTGWENAMIGTMIVNDSGKGEFETVTLGTSAYEALANGAVDFTLEVYTWEGVRAELYGPAQRAFRYADFGVPEQHTTLIGTSSAYLDAHPETAKAFVTATQRGYAYAVAHPDEATNILLAANPDAALDRDFVRASLQALIEGNYLMSEDGAIGTIDATKMDLLGTFLFDAGILMDGNGAVLAAKPDFADYYSNDYLQPTFSE